MPTSCPILPVASDDLMGGEGIVSTSTRLYAVHIFARSLVGRVFLVQTQTAYAAAGRLGLHLWGSSLRAEL